MFEFWFSDRSVNSLSCDGAYLYMLTSNGLYKIGTGLGSTVGGHSYNLNRKITSSSQGLLLYFDVTFTQIYFTNLTFSNLEHCHRTEFH